MNDSLLDEQKPGDETENRETKARATGADLATGQIFIRCYRADGKVCPLGIGTVPDPIIKSIVSYRVPTQIPLLARTGSNKL